MMFVVARGQPAIARTKAAAKRMGGNVQPAVVKVEADLRCRFQSQRPLRIVGIMPCED